MISRFSLYFLLIFSFIFILCNEESTVSTNISNISPNIISVIHPDTLIPGRICTLSVEVSDKDNNSIDYLWSSKNSSFSGSGSSLIYHAPLKLDSMVSAIIDTVSVSVYDNYGGVDSSTFFITITDKKECFFINPIDSQVVTSKYQFSDTPFKVFAVDSK